MSQAINVSIKAPKPDVAIATHQTTPLPLTRASQKEKPVSPGRILRKYRQSIHESNDSDGSDLFPITEDVTQIQRQLHDNTHRNKEAAHLETDPKLAKARISYNNVLGDLATAAEHQKRNTPEIQSNNNEYSSDSTTSGSSGASLHDDRSSNSSSFNHSHSHSLSNHNGANRVSNNTHIPPYIDDDGSETESNVDSSFSNDPDPSHVVTRNRYSTFVKQYVHKPIDGSMDDDDDEDDDDRVYEEDDIIPDLNPTAKKGVSFADDAFDKQPKRSRVRFSVHQDDRKDIDSDSSSSLSSQSEDLMDLWNDNKPSFDIEEIDSIHDLHSNDLKKHRQSKFFKFAGGNFMKHALTLRNLTDIEVRNEPINTPGAPLPDAMEKGLDLEFSHTASTVDFNENLWLPVSDRSDSSEDSMFPQRKKTRRRKTKKRNTALNKARSTAGPRASYDESDIEAEIDVLKRSLLEDDDDEDDGDTYDLDESSSANPFAAIVDNSDDTDNDSDSIHSAYFNHNKQKGDRMWFRHHIGHLKVLKKFFREMDKDGDGTISFEEFTKFLHTYKVNKRFTAEEIERFFLKITDASFDPDQPNVIEEKTPNDNVISPDLLASSNSSLKTPYKDKNSLAVRKSGVAKKTSIFFQRKKDQPTGEVDMATFLFYFSSPIDSNTMNRHNNEYRDGANSIISTALTQHNDADSMKLSSILPAKVTASKYATTYSKAVARAAQQAANKAKKRNNKRVSKQKKKAHIDPSLLFITKSKDVRKRHSLMTKSTSKKLKKRINKNDKALTKRGSISTLRSYHFKQRESKQSRDFDLLMEAKTLPHKMSELLNRDSGKAGSKTIHTLSSSAGSDEWMDKKYSSAEELENLVKVMKRNIQLQDRKSNKYNYKNCFVGRDAVTWFLSKGFVTSRHGGLLLGRRLAQRKYIKYAGNEERDFEDEIIFFYQFTNHKHDPKSSKDDETESLRSSLLEPTLTAKESSSSGNISDMKEEDHMDHESNTSDDHTNYVSLNDDGSDGRRSASNLASVVSKMSASNIARTSHRSNTLSDNKDIFSGTEIVDWLIKHNHAKDRSDGIQFGTGLRSKGFIRHIEFHPMFRDAEDEWYRICDLDNNQVDSNNKQGTNRMSHIMEDEVNNVSLDEIRATMPQMKNQNDTSSKKDSVASNMSTSEYKPLFFGVDHSDRQSQQTNQSAIAERTSLVLGQMGRGRATRGRKREKLVQELFTFIIKSQITTSDEAPVNVSPETLYEMDRIVDGAEHQHIARLLSKIEIKFKKCDEHSRGSLGKEEFNRFLIKCGVILHQQDLNVVFKIFDKNNTGLIDYSNFSENGLVHRVPGIATENLTITHLIKHTISVNFGISAGTKGGDDQYTVIAMAISAAFEEINTSNTGEITLDEFRLSYRKHGIEIYGGVTQIFQCLSKNGHTVTLANFIEAFQGTIFANRSEPPKLKEVLSKLGIIQWTLGKNNNNDNLYAGDSQYNDEYAINEYDDMDDDDDRSVNTAISKKAHNNNMNATLNVTPQQSQLQATITPQTLSSADSREQLNLIEQKSVNTNNSGDGFVVGPPSIGLQSPTVLSLQSGTAHDVLINVEVGGIANESTTSLRMTTNKQKSVGSNLSKLEHGRTETLNTQTETRRSFSGDTQHSLPLHMHISEDSIAAAAGAPSVDIVALETSDITLKRPTSITQEFESAKSPHVRIRLNMREASNKVFITFLKSTAVIAFPGVVLNSLLHFVQAIPVAKEVTGSESSETEDFPLIDLTWYLFGFLVYLALQSTMVGTEVTKSLILLYFVVAGTVGAALAIATIVGFAFGIGQDLRNWGIGWWIGLFLVYLICECAARLKFMKIFGTQRTKREYCWYAVGHAIGVTIFWFLQTFMSILVVNVEFSDVASNRWPLIIYCALTLTVIRNLSLNTLGTTFISKLSDHFYLEDVEVMEMRTDRMLLTQLSIIASYSPLWYLFTKTTEDDWNWVICGILAYQLILLFMDIVLTTYIRPRMISLLKGELIAWFAVGARAIMSFLFPLGFNENNLIEQKYDNKWSKYIDISMTQYWRINLIWCATFALGPILLLLLLWLRVYKIWSYENIENYWDFNDFTIQFAQYRNLLSGRCRCCCRNPSISTSSRAAASNSVHDENDSRLNAPSPTSRNSSNKQRNRLMIICALTIGFIVSVTEAVSLWSDDPTTEKYEGFVNMNW